MSIKKEKSHFKRVLSNESAKKTPTPRAIVIINVHLIAPNCVPKTLKSGSATVIMNPSAIPATITIQIFFFIVMNEPKLSPTELSDNCVPLPYKVIPPIKKMLPTIKPINSKVVNPCGKRKLIRIISRAIGKTEIRASYSVECLKFIILPTYIFYDYHHYTN